MTHREEKTFSITLHLSADFADDFTGDDAIAIGVGMARSYRLRVGDALTLISPQGAATAFGTIPRVRAYKVVAIFDAGLHDFREALAVRPC